MLTKKEREILVRRSKALREEREAIDGMIASYEKDKSDTIAELETMLHLLERDVVEKDDARDVEATDAA